MVENLRCLMCGQEKLEKPKVCYSVFDGVKHPDYICGNCGTPLWKRAEVIIPVISPRPLHVPEEEKKNPERKKPWWFERREEKRRKKQ